MYKIQFGDYNSYDDFGLILTNLTIGEPAPKNNFLNIPALDGQVDLKSALSDAVIYDNRTITYAFVWRDDILNFEDSVRDIVGKLHGQTMNVIHNNSPYYYTGQLTVQSPTLNSISGQATLTISLFAYPYAYKRTVTTATYTLTSSDSAKTLVNSRMRVIPTFTLTGSNATATITFNGLTVTMSAGENRFSDIILAEGENTLTVKGSGTLTVSYREGVL